MDKKRGRSEKRFDAEYHRERKSDRRNKEYFRNKNISAGEGKPGGNEEENTGRKRRYPRPRPDRQFTNIDDYLADRDAKFGKTEEPDRDRIEGRNAVLEAFRAGRTVDKLYLQDGVREGQISSIVREAKKQQTIVRYLKKERLDLMSETGRHQGVIAAVASYQYAEVDDILRKAEEKGEAPYIFLLDGIEDPHNLGAIIRTANLAGAHGVIITKHRAAGLTATVAKASAGALNYTPVVKETNLAAVIDRLKKEGMWFVCADMSGTSMYDLEMKGAVGLVIGAEGKGVSRLIREKCDFTASIPMRGDIDSLNASVAAGILGFEIARQRGI